MRSVHVKMVGGPHAAEMLRAADRSQAAFEYILLIAAGIMFVLVMTFIIKHALR